MAAAIEVPSLALAELRRLIADPMELDKGVRVLDDGGLAHLARHAGRLFAEAAGAAPAPYRVSVAFDDRGGARARCTCMAARSRPFCKHAAALLVAWAQAPEAFAIADGPPPGETEGRRRRAVKTGKTDAAQLMRSGVEQIETLVRELAAAGVASLTGARLDEIRTLAGALRERRLRRLSGRALALADLLEPAARREAVDAGAYAEVMADLLLTARKVERHLDGEALEPRHVEELIGKTWRKADREPVAGLDLVEVAFSIRTTPDDFVIRESRLFDLAGGGHWSEKQILPAFLARRTPPKRSHAGLVLRGASGSAYPGFAPRRLDLEGCEAGAIAAADLARLIDRAAPDVGAALTGFQEHRRDVFAPDRLPVAVRVDTVLVAGGRARVVDAASRALFLPGDDLGESLTAALRDGRLVALLGDVGLDAALPTLWPLAAVIEGGLGLELRALGRPAREPAAPSPWREAARASGASGAAISLAEVRAELADGLVAGLASLGPRVADPLAARLRELGLERPAALLAGLPARPDPEARLDDLVKLYQVLGLALVRLGGAVHVDRSRLQEVPTVESVMVVRRDETIPPREVAGRVASGELGRWDAAVLYSRWYQAMPADQLAGSIDDAWANGAAAPHVARAMTGRGEPAIDAAERALAPGHGRVARMTALRILGAAGGARAETLLEQSGRDDDPGLRTLATDLLEALLVARGALTREAALDRRARLLQASASLVHAMAGAPRADQRELAVAGLARAGARHAIPALRQASVGDASAPVREAAAMALAALGDTEQVDGWVAALARRGDRERDREARVAARALGLLGDVRGLDQLLAAYASGWQPAVVAAALGAFGAAALEPALDLLEARPELGRRKAAAELVHGLPPEDLVAAMTARLRARRGAAELPDLARLYLRLVAGEAQAAARRALAGEVLALIPDGGAGAGPLRKLASDALGA